MNVLGINGSPRGKSSHTDYILQPFLEGASQAGACTETIYLKDHKIKPCTGCFTCWLVTPGECVLKDDMSWILEKVMNANVMVFSTPLYNCSMSALMKAYHERQLPLVKPNVIINEQGEMAHRKHGRGADDGPVWCAVPSAARRPRGLVRLLRLADRLPGPAGTRCRDPTRGAPSPVLPRRGHRPGLPKLYVQLAAIGLPRRPRG